MGGLSLLPAAVAFFTFYFFKPYVVAFLPAVVLTFKSYCPVRAALTFVGCDKSKQKRAFGPSRRSAVAVNFSASAVIKGVKLLPSSHRRSACNVHTDGKIHITTALCEGKAHVQLYLKISSTNESATSVVFIKIRNRLIFSCYFNYRVPDSRNPLRGYFSVIRPPRLYSFLP